MDEGNKFMIYKTFIFQFIIIISQVEKIKKKVEKVILLLLLQMK